MENTQVDNVKYLNVLMPMFDLVEYSNNYSKTSGSLQQYCKNVPNDPIEESEHLNLNQVFQKILTIQINSCTIKYLSNFWRTVEMPLTDCEINVILTCNEKCVISEGNRATTFKIVDTKLYVPVATLPTQDDAALLVR